MNIPHLELVRDWLLAGAPGHIYDQNCGLARAEDTRHDNTDCGTVCCIAGYAATLSGLTPDDSWQQVRAAALEFFDLPHEVFFIGHALFETTREDFDPTPAEAAQAIQNVIEGRQPWTTKP